MKYIPIDLHSHSEHSMDGNHSIEDMCQSAQAKNIKIFAITDHCDINDFEKNDLKHTIQASYENVQRVKNQYENKMKVLFGIELGQPLHDMNKTKKILNQYEFDIILGSVHNVQNRQDFYFLDYQSDALDLNFELEAYFNELIATIQWGGFDSAAHISYPFRYISNNYKKPLNIKRWDDHFDAVVKLLAEKGIALEINTSGLNCKTPYTMPEALWIKRYFEYGGEAITIGSDAHVPENIGSGIWQAIKIAKDCGFNYLTYYEKRQPKYVSIKSLLL